MLSMSAAEWSDMRKKLITITMLMIMCLLTACAKAPDSEERNGVRVAVGGSPYNDYQEKEAERSGSVIGNAGHDLAGSPDPSAEEKILAILNDCSDMKIRQTINAAGGTTLQEEQRCL